MFLSGMYLKKLKNSRQLVSVCGIYLSIAIQEFSLLLFLKFWWRDCWPVRISTESSWRNMSIARELWRMKSSTSTLRRACLCMTWAVWSQCGAGSCSTPSWRPSSCWWRSSWRLKHLWSGAMVKQISFIQIKICFRDLGGLGKKKLKSEVAPANGAVEKKVIEKYEDYN